MSSIDHLHSETELCKKDDSSPVSAITVRMNMGMYEVPLPLSLFGFGMGTMLANFHVWYYVGVKSRNASPRGPICFMYLMFSLSGPCELLFLLWT